MTTTTMRSILRAAIFAGAVGLSPALALAETRSAPVPDHATAEEHRAPEATPVTRVPDHATAERDDGRNAAAPSSVESCACTPDHATAEARGVQR